MKSTRRDSRHGHSHHAQMTIGNSNVSGRRAQVLVVATVAMLAGVAASLGFLVMPRGDADPANSVDSVPMPSSDAETPAAAVALASSGGVNAAAEAVAAETSFLIAPMSAGTT